MYQAHICYPNCPTWLILHSLFVHSILHSLCALQLMLSMQCLSLLCHCLLAMKIINSVQTVYQCRFQIIALLFITLSRAGGVTGVSVFIQPLASTFEVCDHVLLMKPIAFHLLMLPCTSNDCLSRIFSKKKKLGHWLNKKKNRNTHHGRMLDVN